MLQNCNAQSLQQADASRRKWMLQNFLIQATILTRIFDDEKVQRTGLAWYRMKFDLRASSA